MATTVSGEHAVFPPPAAESAVRPIDIGRVVINASEADAQVLTELALLAQRGHALSMERELAFVARSPHTAWARLHDPEALMSVQDRQALTIALKVDNQGMIFPPDRLRPTPEALTVLHGNRHYRGDQHYLDLLHRSYGNDRQDYRNWRFHLIGRLARLAAGR